MLAALLPAIFTDQRIIVKHAISANLAYNIRTLVYLLSKAFNISVPSDCIDVQEIRNSSFMPSAVMTGFSGGVDVYQSYK